MPGPVKTVLAISLLFTPGTLAGQWTDAQLPAGGELQVGLSGRSETGDRRFLPDGNTQSLAEALSVVLDSRLVPGLDTLNAQLGGLFAGLGLPPPESSTLGPLRYDVLFERTRVPLSFRYGVTDWLAPFVVVPFVRGKSFVSPQVDSVAASAGPTSSAFGAEFFADLGEGIASLGDIVSADTLDATRQAQAEALLADAQALEAGLVGISELEYAPTEAGANGQALQGFYASLREGFGAFEVTLPELALAGPASGEAAAAFASGPAFGIETPANRDTGFKIGDIELGLSVQPLNTFRRRPGRQRPLFAIRGRLEALYRFATGSEPAANRITDVGTGDGQPDLEFRTAWDLGLGRRFWVSGFAAYNVQLEADIVRLLTNPLDPVQEGAFTAPVRWDPGDVLTLAAAPRFNLTPSITFSFLYRYERHDRDEVSPGAGFAAGGPFSPDDIEVGTEYETTSLGFAARFSSTDWTGDDRRPALPVEVQLTYLNTVSASEGIVRDTNVWEVGFRYYPHLFGH